MQSREKPNAIRIEASHKSQIPNGEVTLRVVDPAGQAQRTNWFGSPEAADRFQAHGGPCPDADRVHAQWFLFSSVLHRTSDEYVRVFQGRS